MQLYEKYIKRILDIILSSVALIILSPLFLTIAVLIKLKLGSPVIFKQQRPGKDEKIFNIYKFRSMTDERDTKGNLLPDEKRLTKFGKTLRSTSLDELPSLWNILKGEMSFIGPRPLAVQYLPFYNSDEKKRHNIRPGLTGLAQINGRNTIDWEERFKYDLLYLEKITFKTDIKIFIKTILKVVTADDIATRGTTVVMDFDVYRSEENSD